MKAMDDSMQVFSLDALRPRALALVLEGRGEATTRSLAVALAVPFWVADVLMDALQEGGLVLGSECQPCVPGDCRRWRLTLNAGLAVALTLSPRNAAEQAGAARGALSSAARPVSA